MFRPKKSLLFIAFAFCVLASHVFAQRLIAQNENQELADRLWQAFKSAIGNTPITGDAESACRSLIKDALPKVRDKAAAENNIRKFGHELVRQASHDEAGQDKIDLAAYNRAYSSICPLYPFC